MEDLANQITLKVTINRYNSWRWRIWIAVRLIKFAAWLAWLNIDFNEFRKPWLYYCKNCHKDFAGVLPNRGEDLVISCSHCHYQNLVRRRQDNSYTYVWPNEVTCGYECHFQEPYGFVPEAGCPVHD